MSLKINIFSSFFLKNIHIIDLKKYADDKAYKHAYMEWIHEAAEKLNEKKKESK